jgi:hypothetical protein
MSGQEDKKKQGRIQTIILFCFFFERKTLCLYCHFFLIHKTFFFYFCFKNYNCYRKIYKHQILEQSQAKIKERKKEQHRSKREWTCPADRYLGILYHLVAVIVFDVFLES